MIEVCSFADLGRRMALEGKQRVIRVHPAAIVGHTDQAPPTGGELDLDAPGARIETVFDQLLDDRSGPFNDLTRGDAVDESIGQNSDRRHGVYSTDSVA